MAVPPGPPRGPFRPGPFRPGSSPDPWERELSLLTREPTRSALLVDFDGTLAPVVQDPADAVPVAGAGLALGSLARSLGLVGVVSGRPAAFLGARLGEVADRLSLVGLYGLEWFEGGELRTEPGTEAWRPVLAEVAGEARRCAPEGVTVEDKGLAVTLHVRNSPARLAWAEEHASRAAGRYGLVAHPGRLSVELRPPIEVDKGTVVTRLGRGMAAICYVGDDTGDLPAFAALSSLRTEGVATLAVAVSSDEAPGGLLAAADLVVDGPEGVAELLSGLAGRLGATSGSAGPRVAAPSWGAAPRAAPGPGAAPPS